VRENTRQVSHAHAVPKLIGASSVITKPPTSRPSPDRPHLIAHSSASKVSTTVPPNVSATVIFVFGLAVTYIVLPDQSPVDIFFAAAVGVGLALCCATAIEARRGVWGLVRVDALMLWVLYFLTFFEFLFPQTDVDSIISAAAAMNGTFAVLVALSGIALGRHLARNAAADPFRYLGSDVNFFILFLGTSFLGYLHIFIAVDFNLFEALREMALPRFEQSWGRGQFGDTWAMLVEIGALIYLIPPIAGLIYAQGSQYNKYQKIIVTVVLALTIYYGFSTGTRNILATYVITFFGAYFINKKGMGLKQVLIVGAPVVVSLVIIMTYMLDFRTQGLSKFSFANSNLETVYVDHNVVVISRLTDVFPDANAYLGFELPLAVLTRPIPRVLWPEKPETLSFGLEAAMNASPGMTVSSTFVGEAYMTGGYAAVFIFAICLGLLARWWNRLGSASSSNLTKLVYATGFVSAAISMRSVLWLLPTMLPTLALWLYGKVRLSGIFVPK
jgi:oligosaccharide repeat unit polymerase